MPYAKEFGTTVLLFPDNVAANVAAVTKSLRELLYMQHIYCYVDESGQDTQGKFFVVAVALSVAEARDNGEQKLRAAEKSSRKGFMKWKKTSIERKEAYLRAITTIVELENNVFYSIHLNTRDYVSSTVETIAQVLQWKARGIYKVTVEIDGLNKKTSQRMARLLKQKGIVCRKVRGMKDEASAWIRLADAIAGFSRDVSEDKPYTRQLLSFMRTQGFLMEIKKARVSGSRCPT